MILMIKVAADKQSQELGLGHSYSNWFSATQHTVSSNIQTDWVHLQVSLLSPLHPLWRQDASLWACWRSSVQQRLTSGCSLCGVGRRQHQEATGLLFHEITHTYSTLFWMCPLLLPTSSFPQSVLGSPWASSEKCEDDLRTAVSWSEVIMFCPRGFVVL